MRCSLLGVQLSARCLLTTRVGRWSIEMQWRYCSERRNNVRLSVVVPVYNSEKSLPLLMERVSRVLSPERGGVEMILVNDGSSDQSWAVIRELLQTHRWIRGINLMRNCGQHNALLCGIRAARFDVVVTIDDDLHNPPEAILVLVQHLDERYVVVY